MANMGSPISQRSPIHDITASGSLTLSSDLSCTNNNSSEWKKVPSPDLAAPKKSFASTLSSCPTPLAENLSPNIDSIPPKNKKQEEEEEGKESRGVFSDGWSMRTFSELVASSQKERRSFESEQLSSACGKISESSSRFSCSPSFESQTCAACSKLLTERVSFGDHSDEISVAAVLVCGHLYHGECLEILTADKDRYDPICPICTIGEKRMLKMCHKALKEEVKEP